MWARRGLSALVAACLLAGCGTSDHDQVQAKVQQFLQATQRKDYETLCTQVLGPSLLEHLAATGVPCETAMRIGLAGVRSPTLSIARITIAGQSATAIALTGAVGQRASLDAIELTKTSQGWRVESLGAPVAAGKG